MYIKQDSAPQGDATLGSDAFRAVIGHFSSGVAIVTARHDDRDFGATVSAVSSVSLEPPQLLVCINRKNRTCAAVSASRRFAVNILTENQSDLALTFARPGRDREFEALPLDRSDTGLPWLSDTLATIECEVSDTLVSGTHIIFVGSAVSARVREGLPLAYFRGKFGHFAPSLASEAK